MKKLFSLALALVMMLALAVNASAATIDITNAVAGEEYNAYKVFDVKATGTFGAEGTGYAYTITKGSAWWTDVVAYINDSELTNGVYEGNGLKLTPSATNANLYVVEGNSLDAAAFALYLADKVSGKTAQATATADSTSVTLSVTDAGYYFIDSGLGALCALQTSDAEVGVIEKNAVPSLVKTFGDDTVANKNYTIGDTVEYKIVVTDGIGTDKNITVHDVMEAGLTLNTDSIKVDGAPYAYVAPSDECTFEVVLDASQYDDGAQIVITYSAELDKDAEIYGATNDNTAWLTYSAQTSAPSTVKVETYKFDLIKITKDGVVLDGASFKLYDAATAGNEIKLVDMGNNTYRVADATQTGEGATIAAGKVVIEGLGAGTYYLEETAAPEGYNLLAAREEVVLTGNNVATDNGDGTYAGGVQIVNLTGFQLPSTGGVGTTIFYIVGGVMMVAAFVLFVTKKKMANEQ